jgi:L-ascorbate metabolism protein UlaG (beta-lactamase superfamily)
MAIDRDTTFTSYGHSCIEVRTPGGKTIIIDPWFANPNSPRAADSVDACDVLIVTHGHFDHFGNALQVGSRTRPAWPAIHELSLWLARNYAGKDEVIGMNKGGTVDARGIKVTFTHADHSAGDIYGTAEQPIYLGEPVGAVIEVENGFRFYFAGDTDVFGDMRLIAELHRPELAFLPIGDHFTMGPKGAAMAAELLGVAHVIPIHYGTFPVLVGTPDELRGELDARGLDHVQVHAPPPGGSVS